MNDAFGVRGIERIGDLNSQIQHQLDGHWLSADSMLEGLTVEELHGQEGLILMLPNFMNCADVGMIESRSGPGFAPEAFECLRVMREFIGQKFQRHMTPEAEVFGLVNNTHPPAAEFLQNGVVRDGLANHECRRYSWWRYVRAVVNASQSLMGFGIQRGCDGSGRGVGDPEVGAHHAVRLQTPLAPAKQPCADGDGVTLFYNTTRL
jgi:hypothetical protein